MTVVPNRVTYKPGTTLGGEPKLTSILQQIGRTPLVALGRVAGPYSGQIFGNANT